MTARKEVPKRGRGKPVGTRSKPGLYKDIMFLLEQARTDKKDGITAFDISKALEIPFPTIRLYLEDLVATKNVSSKKVCRMTLYRFKTAIKE